MLLRGALYRSLPSEKEKVVTTKTAAVGLKNGLENSLGSVSSAHTSKLDGCAMWTAFREQPDDCVYHNPNLKTQQDGSPTEPPAIVPVF